MKFGLFYEIQVPRPVSPVPEAERLREVVAQVRYAEEMGFDRVWFVEHHFLTEWAHCSASEVMLAVMSQHTTTMRLGFGVVLLPVHHPLHVAAKVATLDVMSGGRVDVGVGRSGNPYQLTPFGVKLEETRERWEEALSIIPRMWTEQVFSHEGKFYQIPPREVIPKPMQQPHPPMFSACSQDDTFQRAGELGLGCLCNVLGSYRRSKNVCKSTKTRWQKPSQSASSSITRSWCPASASATRTNSMRWSAALRSRPGTSTFA
jgi:alkanesulfonate monooxygenase SsuD/methylene tetrahydromethanopterin reductase-like flavin-dependent oxidoreductase (luciferase family)